MSPILIGFVPLFAIMALGYVARKRNFPDEGFWIPCEKIIFFFLLPCLFFKVTYQANLPDPSLLVVPIVICFSMLLFTGIMIAIRPLISKDKPSFTSVYQGVVRSNWYLGISSAAALFGEQGSTIAAVTISFAMPLSNILGIIILSTYGANERKLKPMEIAKKILANPLIISTAFGFSLNHFNVDLPTIVLDSIFLLSNAALPLALLSIGASLRFQLLRKLDMEWVVPSLLKLIIFPAFTGMLMYAYGSPTPLILKAVLLASVPGAMTSYIMARIMGGNVELMNAIVVAQTILALITMPLVLYITKLLIV